MSENTKIEWCDHSWSPWRGCTKVSPGCANCYADALATRFGPTWGNWGKGKPRVLAKNWGDPVKWNKAAGKAWSDRVVASVFTPLDQPELAPAPYVRPTVFPSLCDWLDEEVDAKWLAEFLQLIRRTPNLTWLLLTKRPENFRTRLSEVRELALARSWFELHGFVHHWLDRLDTPPPANVWVGTSVEDQTRSDERIPALLSIPAVGRFISAEPLLGPIETGLTYYDGPQWDYGSEVVEWVIIGGESGPGSRPCKMDWIRSLASQCKAGGVPVFVKQLGAKPEIEAPSGGWMQPFPVRHPKGGDPAEWPEMLRVREFPNFGGAR